MLKKICAFVLFSMLCALMVTPAFAAGEATSLDEKNNAVFSALPSKQIARYNSWVPQEVKEVGTSLGVHRHSPFILTYSYDDSRAVRAETTHTSNSGTALFGYTRARFETVFAGVVPGSDSDRNWKTGASEAESEFNYETAGGWFGIAKTYCGDSSTI